MGRSLQSVMEEEKTLLSEAAVLQLTCRIVGVRLYDPASLKKLEANIDSTLFVFSSAVRCPVLYPRERVCSC